MKAAPLKIYKVEAEGDTLYIQAVDQAIAKATLTAKIGKMPDSILTWSEVKELPEGEEFL